MNKIWYNEVRNWYAYSRRQIRPVIFAEPYMCISGLQEDTHACYSRPGYRVGAWDSRRESINRVHCKILHLLDGHSQEVICDTDAKS